MEDESDREMVGAMEEGRERSDGESVRAVEEV